ncbi:SigE family RNA polymerase sigma factor [Nocardioides sp. URHA0032]|uniref:SigE family RNA polymerase sigma factor n=1 Tax=Nocardioides sp. URHA0032 TaxID=1380388 RepID=UPI00048BB337|nr:SigE family RNA polymerase sigma factor [Nocardioides sp. URHA0032]
MRPDEDYQAFVDARYARLVRSAVLFGCSEQDAEDAVQEALIQCYGAWGRVSTADDRDAYVYRVLVNGITRSRRRRWRGEIPYRDLPEPPATEDPAAGVSLSQSIRASLARLGREQRQVLVLRYFADLTEAQIATVLGIAPGTVKSRASRAIAVLSEDRSLDDLITRTHEENR